MTKAESREAGDGGLVDRVIWLVSYPSPDPRLVNAAAGLSWGAHILWVTPAELGDLTRVGPLDVLVLVGAERWSALARGIHLRAEARGTPNRPWLPQGADTLAEHALNSALVELRAWCAQQFQATLGEAAPKDEVCIGVAAPQRVAPDSTFVLRFAAYPDIPAAREGVESLWRNLSPASPRYLDVRRCIWARKTRVRVRVSGTRFRVSPAAQELEWRGRAELLDFTVGVAPDVMPGDRLALNVAASIDGVEVARVALEVLVDTTGRAHGHQIQSQRAATKAFASYASADRTLVFHRVAALRAAAGMDVFVDCLDLAPGDAYKPHLEQQISARDLFLLFWSEAAARSPWVEWEWRTALGRIGLGKIRPQPLQAKHVPLPPALSALHATDVYMMLADSK